MDVLVIRYIAHVSAALCALLVLQQFNASSGSERTRVQVLNDWLQEHGSPQMESWGSEQQSAV